MSVKFIKQGKMTVSELLDLVAYNTVDGRLYAKKNIGGKRIGDMWGSRTKEGFWVVSIRNRNYSYAHVVWAINKGEWPKKQLVYADGNRDNTRIENLAIVGTRKFNHLGSKSHGYRCVEKDKEMNIIVDALRDHWQHCRERNIEKLSSALRDFLRENWRKNFVEKPVRYFDQQARAAAHV